MFASILRSFLALLQLLSADAVERPKPFEGVKTDASVTKPARRAKERNRHSLEGGPRTKLKYVSPRRHKRNIHIRVDECNVVPVSRCGFGFSRGKQSAACVVNVADGETVVTC